MEKEKKKMIIITVVILLIITMLCGIGYFAYNKLLSNIEEKKDINNINEPQDETANNENNGQVLKTEEYEIINPQRLGYKEYNNDDQWYLVKYDYDKAMETGSPSLDDRISTVDNNIVSKMNGYQYGFIFGYYSNNTFYTSIISDNKLIIKKIDFSAENQSYDEYININMPEDYKLCGLWEGTRENNDCSATILYMNDSNIYIHTVGEKYTNDIYLLNINEKTITKIHSSYRTGPHSSPRINKYNNNLILRTDAGLFVLDETVKNSFETIYSMEHYSTEQLSKPSINNNELYFTVQKIEYGEKNDRTEITIEYKYNFDAKKVSKINTKTNYIPAK